MSHSTCFAYSVSPNQTAQNMHSDLGSTQSAALHCNDQSQLKKSNRNTLHLQSCGLHLFGSEILFP